MANEKSRNHEPTGRNNGGDSKKQGERDADKSAKSAKSGKTGSAGKKPGPGKQARDQLNVRTDAGDPGQKE